MSRLSRDEASSALAVAEFEFSPPPGPVLVLEDPRSDLAEAARSAGVPTRCWSRYDDPLSWPTRDEGLAVVGIRLPRARQEFDMLLHMAADVLPPGGRLLVYGANDEGVKSAPKRLAPLFERAETLATGGHARLIGALRVAGGGPPRAGFAAWESHDDVELPWGRLRWTSYPGVFAQGRLDEGTALLLTHLPRITASARVLDYGAGTGYLAAGVRRRSPGARVTALEVDALAAAAARTNVPGIEVVVGRGWEALGAPSPFDVIVSNPPYHRGKAETLNEIDAFLAGVVGHLAPRGVVRCVVQRRFPLPERAQALGLRGVDAVADEGPYRVWEITV